MAKQHRITTPIPTQPKASRLRSHPRVSTIWINPVTGGEREKAIREFGAAAVEMSRLSKRGDDYTILQRESRPFERAYQKAFEAFLKLTGQPDPDDRTNDLYDAEMEPIMEMFEIAVEVAIEAARLHKAA